MTVRYLAILAADGPSDADPSSDVFRAALRGLGLHRTLTLDGISVFTSMQTPTLDLPSGGVLLGHVFNRRFQPLRFADGIPSHLSGHELTSFILEHYWGEYVLLLPGQGGEGKTTVVRDPSGAVPCVFSTDGRFVTSDLSLATRSGIHQRRINWDFIAHYLQYPHAKTRATGLQGIEELLPGCALHVRSRKASVSPVWFPWHYVRTDERHVSPEEAATSVRSTVEGVTQALADTDRSILLEASGGLDSTIVGACLRGTGADVSCLTLVTPVPGADERRYAGLIAAGLGVPLNDQILSFDAADFESKPPGDLPVPAVTAFQHAIDRIVVDAATAAGVSSLYSGGGGDTVFGSLASASPAADAVKELGIRRGLSTMMSLSEIHRCTFWKAAGLSVRKLVHPTRAPRKPDTSLLRPSLETMAVEEHPWWQLPPETLPGDRERIIDLAGTQVFRDGAPRRYRFALRLPLLSQPVMEECLRVPSWMWLLGGRNRAIARNAFSDVLPEAVARRRSKGNFTHYIGGIYQRQKHAMRNMLIEGELQARGLVDPEAVAAFVERPLLPRDKTFLRMFDLAMVENWVRHQG
ncbi:asparagine synthase C-terminal domain-containing protein [Luteimonas sp. RD2P54]|uniref:asparagine synthase (glutamine-hydrolyzing) n=1 Tax=Luteimonas endophytica TaxID=3042023 RepID=A0ABT6J7B3_9GAMM|nr:asparagine synthase C-terminal domain-containing protein [Luteimonas endophytica]MDH5822708.1 asparagine synthase C-terminal domain-containing protein [Luteimonas endophytica]